MQRIIFATGNAGKMINVRNQGNSVRLKAGRKSC